jgi:hypothetical protein
MPGTAAVSTAAAQSTDSRAALVRRCGPQQDPVVDSDPVLRRDLVSDGYTDDELARLVRSGDLTRLRRGAYLTATPPLTQSERHRLLVHATLRSLRRPAVVSHHSAAVLHGLPVWGAGLARVHVTRRPPASSELGRYLRTHVARLRDDELAVVDGVLVTDPARTLLDLARTVPFEPAVTALDAALFRRAVSPDLLVLRLADIAGTSGSRAAARAVAFADGRSESVGESRSRVLLRRLGLPPPGLQLRIPVSGVASPARVDFAWEDERVVGEFDGRVTYGRLLRAGQEPGDAVFQEKRREDAIRDENWRVVRWTWGELNPGDVVGERVRRGLERGRRRTG